MPPAAPQQPQKEPLGPVVGVVIILILMIAGAIYLWQLEQNQKHRSLPYIPGNSSTTTAQ